MIDTRKSPSENEAQYIWRICQAKDTGTLANSKWEDVASIINKELYGADEESYKGASAYRKRYQYAKDLFENHVFDTPVEDLDAKLQELRKERMKLQTLNLERTRIDKCEARHELFYEYIGSVCQALPWPHFQPLYLNRDSDMKYLCTIADIHYGATFKSVNNEYSPAIAQDRLDLYAGHVIDFIKKHELNQLSVVNLGDSLQGILRLTDLKINDSSVVKSIVEISRLLAVFINELSAYCKIDYYHVPSANHSQIRPLGSKASEIADEDLEYVIGNYIKDLCINNDRITVHLAKEGSQYIDIEGLGSTVVAGHGHTLKNLDTSIRDLSMLQQRNIDYVILGHFHGNKSFSTNESVCSDQEVIVCPSFIGSDNYSDSLMKGSKSAAKILGFDEVYGLTEQYKFILN